MSKSRETYNLFKKISYIYTDQCTVWNFFYAFRACEFEKQYIRNLPKPVQDLLNE